VILFGLIRKLKSLFKPKVDIISDEKLKELEKALGLRIKNRDIFVQALTHRSFVPIAKNKFKIRLESNERLEFWWSQCFNSFQKV